MILKKADASGNSVPFKAAEFRGHDSYPALSALEDINQSAIILFHPFYGTVECKWLSGGEYVTLFRIHPHETGLSEKNGITVPIGKLIFGVEDEAACLERLRAEMFEAVQTLAFEGTKLPGLSPLQSTRNFWATQADLIGGMCGIPEDPRGKPHRPNYEAYAKKAAARFFIIAKLNEAIRILSSSALLTASKAAWRIWLRSGRAYKKTAPKRLQNVSDRKTGNPPKRLFRKSGERNQTMKRDPSWIKFYGIGGGTTEPVDIGAGSGDAPISGGSGNDKLPKAWPCKAGPRKSVRCRPRKSGNVL